jgi:hypothetical protein
MIEVRQRAEVDPLEFDVVVGEGEDKTSHRVTISRGMLTRLAAGRHAERAIEAVFRFLLDREPKEAILRRFDVAVVARYFPEFERELPRYLSRDRS